MPSDSRTDQTRLYAAPDQEETAAQLILGHTTSRRRRSVMRCRIRGMMPTGRGVVRLLWLVNTLILLAVVLPAMLDHPYPKPVRPYIEWGGLLLYIIGGLCLVAVSGRLRGPSSK